MNPAGSRNPAGLKKRGIWSTVSTTFSSLFIFSQYAQSQAGRTKTAGLGESAVLILEQN